MVTQKGLCEICSPKQWKTISSDMLLDSGYPVYGANGIIGYYSEFNHIKKTLLITCRGATCGNLNICESYSYVNGNAMALNELSDDVDVQFLYYYLQYKGFFDVITGSAQPQIVRRSLEKVYVTYPEIERQKEIVILLNKISDLISLRKQQLAKLDELVMSRFIELFGDPVHPHRSQPLGNIALLERGRFSPRPRNDPRYYGGDYPFIQTGDIANCGHRLSRYKQTLNDKGIQVSKKFGAGTIVIAIVGATIGATAILEIEVYAPDSVIGITVDSSRYNNVFMETLLQFWQPELLRIAPESARANINLTILQNIPIIDVELEPQKQFAAFVEQTDKSKLCGVTEVAA